MPLRHRLQPSQYCQNREMARNEFKVFFYTTPAKSNPDFLQNYGGAARHVGKNEIDRLSGAAASCQLPVKQYLLILAHIVEHSLNRGGEFLAGRAAWQFAGRARGG